MQTFSTKAQLRAALLKHHRKHDHVVLVPTMGALHAGHRALLEQARKLAGEDGVVVASIFVNPIQFNNSSDLQTYPRTPEKDLEVCEGAGVDYVFSPAPEEMYSGERSIAVEESFLSTTLCGASRPGHFSGVCTVLAKLFNLVQPTDAIFGKKDYQQLAIIRRMVRDLDFPVRIHGAEIVRHGNGLAYSSRNARLTPEQNPAAITQDAFFQGGKGWFFNVSMQNESDVAFVPESVTVAYFYQGKQQRQVAQPTSAFGFGEMRKGGEPMIYEDAASYQALDSVGVMLKGTDANGNALSFTTLVYFSQETNP